MSVSRAWVSLFLLILFAASLHAQTTGEVRGIVSDPSGAPIPGAKVNLTSNETGEARAATTDQEGRYTFSLLKIGEYTLAVEAPAFRRLTTVVGVRSAEITSANPKLEVGQVTEQVVVTDVVSALDSQNAQIQESFQTKVVQEIPIARNPNNIASTLPGIVPAMGGMNSGSFFSNGNRARANNITIDNITATDVSVAGTGSSNNNPLNFSSIKEIKIITNNFSAEFGRNSGAQVQYITKSGTNSFHGEAYEYLRNNVFNARDWFDRTGRVTPIRYNQFGGVFGGPLIRNKTHFFGSAEKLIQRGAGAARTAQVPTAAMLARVTDPTSRRLLDQYKLPAAETIGNDFGTVQQNASNAVDNYQWSVRIDHQFSDSDSIYGRLGWSGNTGTSSANTFIETNIGNFGLQSVNRPISSNLNETHIFTPNVINEFRSGFGRTFPDFSFLTDVPLGPRIIFADNNINRFGHYEGGPQGRVQNTYQVGDTLTWTSGAHNVKMGGDFYRYQANSYFEIDTRGTYTFLNWDDFAIGKPNAYTQRYGSTVRGNRTWIQSAFVQDDYRITPTLTLNLGFRLEVYGPNSEVNKLISNLDFNCSSAVGDAGAGPLGCITTGRNATSTNRYWQPRFGLAWSPGGGKTVIRGGYGLVADFNFLNPITNQRSLPPLVSNVNLSGKDTAFQGANTWANLFAGTAPIQAQGAAQVGRFPAGVLNFGNFNPVIDPELKNPQVHQWNIGVQRELPSAIVLKAMYVGTKANFLQRARQVNLNANMPAPATSLADEAARTQQFVDSYDALTGNATRRSGRLDPRFNIVNYYDNSANSNFHAFEVLATRPFRGGYQFQAGYTFSKSMDDVSDALNNLPNDSSLIQDPRNVRDNRGVSAYDTPHRVVLTHVWELPWGARLSNPVLRRLAGGWGMSGISSWRAGFPVTFDSGPRRGVQNIATITTAGIIRPNTSGPFEFNPQPAGSATAPQGLTNGISTYAASLGLSQPLLGNFGNLGRNTHRIGGQTNFDWNVYKNTTITERVNMQLRLEMYNVFNHHSFQDVNRNISSSAFGQYTTPAQTQRIMQLGAVLRF